MVEACTHDVATQFNCVNKCMVTNPVNSGINQTWAISTLEISVL